MAIVELYVHQEGIARTATRLSVTVNVAAGFYSAFHV